MENKQCEVIFSGRSIRECGGKYWEKFRGGGVNGCRDMSYNKILLV